MSDATKDISSRGSKHDSIFSCDSRLAAVLFQLNFKSKSAPNVVKHHGNLREGVIPLFFSSILPSL